MFDVADVWWSLCLHIYTHICRFTETNCQKSKDSSKYEKEFQADKILLKQGEHIASFSLRNETQNWDVEGMGVACCPQDHQPPPTPYPRLNASLCQRHLPGPCPTSEGDLCGGVCMKSRPLSSYTILAFLFRMLPYPNILFWETSDLIKMVQRTPMNS